MKSGGVWSPINAFRQAVFVEAINVRPAIPMDGPLRLEIDFIFPRPKSCPANQVLKWTKPDTDNLLKASMDALTNARWWIDDGRVAKIQTCKRYPFDGEHIGAAINVTTLKDPAWRSA